MDLVTFTTEILNGKLHFLWSGSSELLLKIGYVTEKVSLQLNPQFQTFLQKMPVITFM